MTKLLVTLLLFFDIPRKNKIGYSEEDYKKLIGTIVRKISLNLTKINCFYIDDYDIDDSLTIAGIPAKGKRPHDRFYFEREEERKQKIRDNITELECQL